MEKLVKLSKNERTKRGKKIVFSEMGFTNEMISGTLTRVRMLKILKKKLITKS